jgi:hypothetical protein
MNIYKLLPKEISDESAYHLATFFMNLALELESHYFAQMRRHIELITPCSANPFTADEPFEDDIPF